MRSSPASVAGARRRSPGWRRCRRLCACAALVEELGLTREEVGRRVGRSRVAVSNLVRLLDLPDEVIELLQAGALSEGHGRALLLAEDHAARAALPRPAVQEGGAV